MGPDTQAIPTPEILGHEEFCCPRDYSTPQAAAKGCRVTQQFD